MIPNKILKLKKYLFLISIIFFVLSLSHLIYYFLYDDAELVPIKWWTVSEWIVWSFPSLNPLKPLSWNNEYLVRLLYRSLLQYDNDEKKIVSDLASCDISNLLQIECYLKDNIYWSDWKAITVEDVVETYNLLKTTWVNKVASSLLEETKIEKNGNSIIFKNTKKDINFLNIFFQPILSKSVIDSIWTNIIFWNFPTNWLVYSWEFEISNISSDMTIWITKIFLTKNAYNEKGNISKLIIKVFSSANSLLQNKWTINIFNDNDNLIWDSIPRLQSYKYTLSQYVSVFLNKENIEDIDLRNTILNKINSNNLIKILWENYSKVINPYITEYSIDKELWNRSYDNIMANMGYKKKPKLLETYLPKQINSYSSEVQIEKKEKEINLEWIDINIGQFQSDSKYIISPEYVDIYNFITKDDILLTWVANSNVTEVYINDYKLSNYEAWDKNFYYRLKKSYNSISEWENNYKIYFVENWKKVLKEEIHFLFYNDKQELEKEEKKYIENLYIEQKKKEIEQEKTKVDSFKKIEVDNEKIKEISELDDNYYYNNNLEKYSLDLYYIATEKNLEDTAIFIKNSLVEIWINIELFPISLSDISKIINDKEKYDMLLTWVNLWYFNYNIFPYFHSSQVKNWYNFSQIKKTSLDILLEELKSETLWEEELEKIENKILDILKKEQVVKTLYTPKINLLIDKNIKNVNIEDKLSNKSLRKVLFNDIYIKEQKNINFENKWIIDFFNYLIGKINA